MTTPIWVAVIGSVTTLLVVIIPILVNWFNRRINKREEDCKKELEEMRSEYKKAIQLAIEQNKHL